MGDCVIAAIVQKYCNFEESDEEEIEDKKIEEIGSDVLE